jgi:hypothetical protein
MKKHALSFLALLLVAGPVAANCFGTATLKTCTDDSGNTYTVQRLGNTTFVDGYNAQTGSQWSQNTQRVGNISYTTGNDADGNSWSQTTQRLGNTTYQYGYDSDGNSFNGTIQRSSSSTIYSGTDSSGNSYYKTCTAYGCF